MSYFCCSETIHHRLMSYSVVNDIDWKYLNEISDKSILSSATQSNLFSFYIELFTTSVIYYQFIFAWLLVCLPFYHIPLTLFSILFKFNSAIYFQATFRSLHADEAVYWRHSRSWVLAKQYWFARLSFFSH